MATALIINPNAGTAAQAEVLQDALEAMSGITIYETAAPGDGTRLAREAAESGCERIIAAGGDGTINEVVNGLVDIPGVTLGVIPLGTGNDLARTLALPEDPVAAFELACGGAARPLDIIKIISGPLCHYALNVSAGGFSGELGDVLTTELKATWGPLAYLRGAAELLADLKSYVTTIAYDDEEPEQVDAINIIVANCRTAAGGVQVAPLANPEDGLLDIVIVHYGTLGELAGAAARLLINGNYLDSANVTHRRARTVTITATPGMWFNADGELLTNAPATFAVLPGALRVVVGPEYRAEAPQAAAS